MTAKSNITDDIPTYLPGLPVPTYYITLNDFDPAAYEIRAGDSKLVNLV